MGRAASASRAKLQRVIGAALYSLGLDLANASRALRSEASRLEQEAAALRSRGRALAEAEARSARALAAGANAGDARFGRRPALLASPPRAGDR